MTDIDLSLTEIYPHPVEKVWQAITTQAGLEAWLMQNDFELRIGHECTFRFCASEGSDEDSLVFVRVLEINAPHHMLWRWRNENDPDASLVTFRLREVPEGTELTIEHKGPVSADVERELRKGWPSKLQSLRSHLEQKKQ